MARCCSKSSLVRALCLLAREDKVYRLFAREARRTVEKVKGYKTPVDAVQAEMFSVVILKLILAL